MLHEGKGLTVLHVYLPLALAQPTHSLHDRAAASAQRTVPHHNTHCGCCNSTLSMRALS